jgi:hypothetical protein
MIPTTLRANAAFTIFFQHKECKTENTLKKKRERVFRERMRRRIESVIEEE